MGRPGRKRKAGARERNGRSRRRPKAEQIEERVRIARNQPHRRTLRSNDRMSELAESALGRLLLRGLISPAERAAGESFAAIVTRYRAVIEGPRPVRSLMPAVVPERADPEAHEGASRFSCASAHADPIERTLFGRAQPPPTNPAARSPMMFYEWPCQQPGETCECAIRRARYMRAYEAIAAAGREAMRAVIAAAVRGEEIAPTQIVYLKRGLRAAALHLGLTALDR